MMQAKTEMNASVPFSALTLGKVLKNPILAEEPQRNARFHLPDSRNCWGHIISKNQKPASEE